MKEIIYKYHRPIIWTLLIFQLLLFAINIPGLSVKIDESWIGEPAYYLAESGVVKSETFQDYLRRDERILLYHKAFVWIGALSIKSFGFSLYSLRSVSFLSSILLAGLLYGFCRKQYNMTIFRITLVILLFCPLIFRNAVLYRPEIMLCTTGFLSFVFLYQFIHNKKLLFLILSAVLAGFSPLVHLNGIIFIGAGAILLLCEKKWGYFIVYSAVATLVASFYFYELLGNMELFSLQLTQSSSNAIGNFQWYMPFTNLIDEHKRLFRKPEIIGITVLFLLAAFYWIKNRPTNRKLLLVYTFCLIILMGAINHNKTTKYAILLFPYFALLIAEYIYMLITDRKRISGLLPKLFLVMLSLTILFGSYSAINLILFGKENWVGNHRAVAEHIPKDSKVLAPIKFMFNEINNYEIFGLLPARIILDKRGKIFTVENLCQIADEYNVEYIIINEQYRKQLDCAPNDTTCLKYGRYEYFISQGKYDIYKRGSENVE